MIDSSIAHYKITALLGKGGMGEVYRARDERLNRDVAIKLLPEALSADPARLARFKREAQLLASLNHPNIGQVYGFEEQEGRSAIVLELIEGDTLAERLERGPLPLDEAQKAALQIALALEAAHEKGTVHRDLKPANIKFSADGAVKVLDFGLAKALDPTVPDTSESDGLEHSPTMTSAGTMAGVILGTASYMSPEQAKGEPVDKRADIWAFGVVLSEMLTGRKLFAAPTAPEILAQVLTSSPDQSELPPGVPAALRRLLRRCMTRDPKSRLHDIADARIVLEDLVAGVAEDEAPLAGGAAPAASRSVLPWIAALVVVAAAAGLLGYVLPRSSTTADAGPRHLAIQLGANRELLTAGNGTIVFSPDGETLVFPGREEGRQSLFRRELGKREAEPIPGTENAEAPFFSSDGQWLGFVAGGELWKIAAEGGRPFRLADARGAGGATWLGDDTLVFAPIYSDGLFRVDAEGGEPERLTTPDRDDGELGHWWPDPLPGNRRVLFTAFRTPVDRSKIGVVDLETDEISWIVEGGFFGRYVSTGHLLYAKGTRLYALPFDPETATATGSAVPVLEEVAVSQTSGFAVAAVSSRGMLAYIAESVGNPPREIVWLDRKGGVEPAIEERRRYVSANLSPDGRRAALTIRGESRDLWTYSFERGTMSRLTSGEDTEFDPKWSAGGDELFYIVDSPPFELYRIAANAPDSGRPIWDEPAVLDTTGIAVSPDGRTLAYVLTEEGTGQNLYARPIDGSEPPRPIRATRSEENSLSFSPDGGFVVYQSNETGRPEIYVEAFPGGGQRVQVSADGGSEPLWARNGEIFYRHDDEMRVVATRPGRNPEFDAAVTLFRFGFIPAAIDDGRKFDVTRDGKRILAVTIPDIDRPRRIEIVTDWTSTLQEAGSRP